MVNFIDRRLNPKDKSLGNRRRFIRRVRSYVKRAVDEAVRERGIADVDRSETVTVPTDSIQEPHFHHSSEGGRRERVLPGNKQFRTGDQIAKPPGGAGGGRGREGSPDGEGEDDFVFVLSRDEFLDIFFEDLELPDLVKKSLQEITAAMPRRAGISVSGAPANLNVGRTMRNALGRRIALKRPKRPPGGRAARRASSRSRRCTTPTPSSATSCSRCGAELEEMLRRQKLIPWLDPLDVRYSHFEPQPEPNSNAVMFCLMDVSASMGQREKDLAKRFFILLHLFLQRRYDKVELVFIRHTHHASEVDEDTFFHSRDTGGTVVSTALTEMKRILDDALFAVGVEHLRRPGLGRRQLFGRLGQVRWPA